MAAWPVRTRLPGSMCLNQIVPPRSLELADTKSFFGPRLYVATWMSLSTRSTACLLAITLLISWMLSFSDASWDFDTPWSNDLLVLLSEIVHRSGTRPMTFVQKSTRWIIVALDFDNAALVPHPFLYCSCLLLGSSGWLGQIQLCTIVEGCDSHCRSFFRWPDYEPLRPYWSPWKYDFFVFW